MESTKRIKLNLAEKFADKDYFDAFFAERASDDIASKIKELRDSQDLSQSRFAELCEMKQSAISRIESAEYSGWNFKTLLRVASALDARLAITLIPRSEVVAEYQKMELAEDGLKIVDTTDAGAAAHAQYATNTFTTSAVSTSAYQLPLLGNALEAKK